MQAVKARAHQQPLPQPAERQPDVGMLQTLQRTRHQRQRDKLVGRHADQQRQRCEKCRHQHVVEHMVAIVRPQAKLTLAVVHRVQFPPPLDLVLGAVIPVTSKVEHDQVDQEADQRSVGDARPQRVEVEVVHPAQAEPFLQAVKRGLQGEKQHQIDQPQAVDEGVEHIHPHRAAVGPDFKWPQRFERPQHGVDHADLQQPGKKPQHAVIGEIVIHHEVKVVEHRLHQGDENPGLRLADEQAGGVADPVERIEHGGGWRRSAGAQRAAAMVGVGFSCSDAAC